MNLLFSAKMPSSVKSNFQRSQSKVWWAQQPNRDHYGFLSLPVRPLEPTVTTVKSTHSPNIPKEISVTSWSYRRGSPGSLKSHDSGFSDSDQSPPTNNTSSKNNKSSPTPNNNFNLKSPDKLTPKTSVDQEISTAVDQQSPSISSCELVTPPTVIRKKINTESFHPDTCRRISFSTSSSPIYERIESPDSLINKIDSFHFDNTSPDVSNSSLNKSSSSNCQCPETSTPSPKNKLRRNSKLLKCVSQLSLESTDNFYYMSCAPQNSATSSTLAIQCEPEVMMQTTIRKSAAPQTPTSTSTRRFSQSYHNETVVFGSGKDSIIDDLKQNHPSSTSTPKNDRNPNLSSAEMLKQAKDSFRSQDSLVEMLDLTPTLNWQNCTYVEYANNMLNGHSSSVQFWLDELRSTYCHEVLSTLQTKSVAKTVIVSNIMQTNSATAGKIIRQLQSKAVMLQYEFDRLEKLLLDHQRENDEDDVDELVKTVPTLVKRLHANIMLFVRKLECKDTTNSENYRRLKRNIISIIDMSYDLDASVASRTRIEPTVLCENIQILKRLLLITISMVFEKYMRIIVDRIENVQCNLIMRSNLCMISMLSNMEYTGFASLADVFNSTRIVKVLLEICVESQLSSVRTLALRGLASICSSIESIRQFQNAGGTEILKDILVQQGHADTKRSDPEIKEALSVFTQITAPWHGVEHKISSLNDFADCLVERITRLAIRTQCSQTLLLAVAALNNISKMESVALYSLMANETVLQLKSTFETKGTRNSIFLYVSSVFKFLNAALNTLFAFYRNN